MRKLIGNGSVSVVVLWSCLAFEIQTGLGLDSAVVVSAKFESLSEAGAATLQARLLPSFPAIFGQKNVTLLPVASGGQPGPEAQDAAAFDFEGKASILLVGAALAGSWLGCDFLWTCWKR